MFFLCVCFLTAPNTGIFNRYFGNENVTDYLAVLPNYQRYSPPLCTSHFMTMANIGPGNSEDFDFFCAKLRYAQHLFMV